MTIHAQSLDAFNTNRIQPFRKNPFYWQYRGNPALLLGGSDDDNLFQWEEKALEAHLRLMRSVGANYVRNTMSSRDEGRPEAATFQPFAGARGSYDLDQWNEDYWNRFRTFLRLTQEHEVFVQIELWDMWDFLKDEWQRNSWNPTNNITLSCDDTVLTPGWESPMEKAVPFFTSVPRVKNDEKLLHYQRRFIDKVLSISLDYDHVLYCIDNEIHPPFPREWGWYWAQFVRDRASKKGVGVEVTEMYWQTNLRDPQHLGSLDHPELFSFFEASQNSAVKNIEGNQGQENWEQLQHIRNQLLSRGPRPINNVKIYGSDTSAVWSGKTRDAQERLWRNILGGSASSRFHRPKGLGLSEAAQVHLRSLRMLTDALHIFDCEPHNDLLSDREANDTYCSSRIGERYALYFPNGGAVRIDLSGAPGALILQWLDISNGVWGEVQSITGGGKVHLTAPGEGHWAALIRRR